jgi:hypothetical protein
MATRTRIHGYLKQPDPRTFDRTFAPLRLHTFWSIELGFDLLAFDAAIGTPDDVSTAQHVEATYGPEAVAIVRGLL